jgi:hypothetical protein
MSTYITDCTPLGRRPTATPVTALSSYSFANLHDDPGDEDTFQGSVVEAKFSIPALSFSGDDMGAGAIQSALNADVWYATVTPQLGVADEGTFTNIWAGITGSISTRYPDAHLLVDLKRKDGIGFDPVVGGQVVTAAAQNYGTLLAAFEQWVVNVVNTGESDVQSLDPLAVAQTDANYWSNKLSDIGRIGLGPAFGLPGWFFPAIAAGAVGIVAMAYREPIMDAYHGGKSLASAFKSRKT